MATYFRAFDDADGISDFTEVAYASGHTSPAWSVVNTDQVQATSASTHSEGLVWNDIDSDADSDDVEIYGEIYVDSTSTTQRWYAFRVSTSGASRTGYALRVRTSTFDLYKFNGATFTQVATTTVSITSGTWIKVRFRMNGSDIAARYWTTTEDTGSWTVSQSGETTYTTAGHVGLLKGANTNTQLWRDFGVGTNGDTAPSSAGGGGYTLTVTQGAYALTGQSVNLTSARKLAVTQGSYALTGQSVTLTKTVAASLAATQGSYALTGQSVGLRAARNLIVTQGAYALAGQSVTLTKASASALNVTQGAYALTGQSVNLKAARKLAVTQGAYGLSGQSVTLTKSAAGGLNVTQGNYTLNGQAVNLRTARRVSITQGAYSLAGQSVTLTKAAAGRVLNVTQGAYAITGQAVQMRGARRLAVTYGQYALTGRQVTFTYGGLQIFTRPPKRASIAGRPRQMAVLLGNPSRDFGNILKG